jgi:cytochrome c oxidase subunit 2
VRSGGQFRDSARQLLTSGPSPHVVFVILIALGVVWTAFWAFVLVQSRRAIPFDELERPETRLRLVLLGGLGVVSIVLFGLTLRSLPFPNTRTARVGVPQIVVDATGMQWSWMLSRRELPARVPIAFAVGSRDVNHDFAIYDSTGRLLAQVQGMPGYTNRLLYVFPGAGEYTVRCLEYCGLGHHTMSTTFTVTDR